MNSCSEDPVYWVILTSHLDSRTKCQGRVTARAIFNSQCAELLTYREECRVQLTADVVSSGAISNPGFSQYFLTEMVKPRQTI